MAAAVGIGAAHPRSRGENWVIRSPCIPRAGSSPLTRGKLHEAVNLGAIRRLIPAHAGKTPDQCSHAARQPAHPRSRGENPRMNLSPGLATGSSPLTRGKPEDELVAGLSDRLIPAHAGKTDRADLFWELRGAHPRSRGENLSGDPRCNFVQGSSPLTRGKQRDVEAPLRQLRLIPAHAGKTTRR